jgi:ABC-2 type transport system ATP-binding protein
VTQSIVISDVSKIFQGKVALSHVSVSVPPGVVFALLGENGAGKSTLIRGLMGYHRFDLGEIQVLGMDPAKQPLEVRRRVGYVADAPGLYEWMTVTQIGWYASGFYSEGYLGKFAALTSEFELPSNAKIRDLSKGMRAKVALALAMAFDPELLILDEPTSGLDPHVRRAFLESMVERAANGQTVFLSSHQIHEVERVADWIAILHKGELKIAAPLEELKSQMVRLSFSMRDPLLALPSVIEDLCVVHRTQTGRTLTMMIRSMPVELELQLHSDANLFDIKSIRPNLEELYFAFTQPTLSGLDTNGLQQQHRSAS